MKKYTIFLVLLTIKLDAIGCEACNKQQPKLLRGITHGSGPDSSWDYLIVGAMIITALYILIATIKCVARPGERDQAHIKRMILNDPDQ